LFELGGADVILRIAWLATLGDVKVNCKTLTMDFFSQGHKVQGDHILSKMLVTPHVLMKEKGIETVSVLWGIEVADSIMTKGRFLGFDRSVNKEVDGVLKEYLKKLKNFLSTRK